jgi:hypothetical protein
MCLTSMSSSLLSLKEHSDPLIGLRQASYILAYLSLCFIIKQLLLLFPLTDEYSPVFYYGYMY